MKNYAHHFTPSVPILLAALSLFLGGCHESQEQLDSEFSFAFQANDLPGMRAAIAQGADLSGSKGNDYFVRAIQGGKTELADLLFARGMDVNFDAARNTLTPLRASITAGDAVMAGKLLAKGANVNHRNWDGQTPLMMYATGEAYNNGRGGGSSRVYSLLLSHRPDVNIQDNNGYTVLMYAALRDNAALVRDMLARGADPGKTARVTNPDIAGPTMDPKTGDTALLIARRRHHADVISLLLAARTAPKSKDFRR